MKAVHDLLSTDYGLMSIGIIIVMIVGLGYAYTVLRKKMAESERISHK